MDLPTWSVLVMPDVFYVLCHRIIKFLWLSRTCLNGQVQGLQRVQKFQAKIGCRSKTRMKTRYFWGTSTVEAILLVLLYSFFFLMVEQKAWFCWIKNPCQFVKPHFLPEKSGTQLSNCRVSIWAARCHGWNRRNKRSTRTEDEETDGCDRTKLDGL